jgi:DNA-binding CsgD family transcriptional regulator
VAKKLWNGKGNGSGAPSNDATAGPKKGSAFGVRARETAGTPCDGELLALLTDREREVLRLYVPSMNAKEVAHRLGTKVQTVRNQLASIEHKLGVEGREALIVFALKHGL